MREPVGGIGIGAQYVTRQFDQSAIFRSYPNAVRHATAPEFTSKAYVGWCESKIQQILTQPGRPIQNG